MLERVRKMFDRSVEPDEMVEPTLREPYQTLRRLTQEYRNGQIKDLRVYLEQQTPELLRSLRTILQKDPELESGLISEKNRQLWQTIGYILSIIAATPTMPQQSEAGDLLVQLGWIADYDEHSLIDKPLIEQVGRMHLASRPDLSSQGYTENNIEQIQRRAEVVRPIILQWLQHYTTEDVTVLNAWIDSASNSTELLRSVRYLEKARPGSVDFLVKKYGVMNFARYPERVLLKQFDQRADIATPYGLVISARADHNGALLNSRNGIAHLDEQLEGWCNINVIEAASKNELARRLLQIRERYSPTDRKAEFALIEAHSNEGVLVLGRKRQGANGLITIEELSKAFGMQRGRKEFFVDDATLIFSACRIGRAGGFAEKVAKDFHINTIGPDFETSAEDITVQALPNGHNEFSVRYVGQKWYKQAVRKYQAQ
ncbi:MAG: hypothetical protein ACD_43C00040G0001 [uncultured bacterium]|nr:MAG: hypothetical protein ACD_43C00040G0001 [uncultured bacterium]